MGKGIFAWVHPLVKTKEQDLLPLIGLDAIVFLRVLRMCRNMFLALSVIGCGILIPINLTTAAKAVGYSKTEFVARVTPINTFGSANWGMTICAWLFNVIVAGFLWWNYRVVLKLRRQYFDSTDYQAGLHARTLMVGSANSVPC
jgi:calcium permeable stress-gated cation channel